MTSFFLRAIADALPLLLFLLLHILQVDKAGYIYLKNREHDRVYNRKSIKRKCSVVRLHWILFNWKFSVDTFGIKLDKSLELLI